MFQLQQGARVSHQPTAFGPRTNDDHAASMGAAEAARANAQQLQQPGGGADVAAVGQKKKERPVDDPTSLAKFSTQLQKRGFDIMFEEMAQHPAMFEAVPNPEVTGDYVNERGETREDVIDRKARALLAAYYNWNHRMYPKLTLKATMTNLSRLSSVREAKNAKAQRPVLALRPFEDATRRKAAMEREKRRQARRKQKEEADALVTQEIVDRHTTQQLADHHNDDDDDDDNNVQEKTRRQQQQQEEEVVGDGPSVPFNSAAATAPQIQSRSNDDDNHQQGEMQQQLQQQQQQPEQEEPVQDLQTLQLQIDDADDDDCELQIED